MKAPRFGTYSLGELNSYIRFSFDNPQDFRTIKRYYKIVKSLIAILTKQNNVSFNAYLSQKNSQNCLFETAECKIFDRYPNYSLRKDHNVIPLISIIEYVPNLIEKIANSEAEVLLPLLPADNKMVNKITITNIQDLCTALEVAYNWGSLVRNCSLRRDRKSQIRNRHAVLPLPQSCNLSVQAFAGGQLCCRYPR